MEFFLRSYTLGKALRRRRHPWLIIKKFRLYFSFHLRRHEVKNLARSFHLRYRSYLPQGQTHSRLFHPLRTGLFSTEGYTSIAKLSKNWKIKKIFLIEIHVLGAFLQQSHSFPNKKRIFIIHNSAHLYFAPKWITIHGRVATAPSPTQWKLKRENPSASYGGVLSPSFIRDAFGMRSGRKQRFVFTCEPSRSTSILF